MGLMDAWAKSREKAKQDALDREAKMRIEMELKLE